MTALDSLLERAERAIASARLLLDDGDYDTSASRSYYAMFYCVDAALLTKGLTVSTHAGAVSAFGEHFVRPGIFPRQLGKDFSQALEARFLGDYGHKATISRAAAEDLLSKARAFVDAVGRHLRAAGDKR